jgi:hypothetical protein
VDEITEDPERGSRRLGRSPDHGDSAGRLEDRLDPVVSDQGDRAHALVEVEDLARPGALLGTQPRASFSYGMPSAAGGIDRPTTPARMMIVRTYGNAA